MGKTLFRAAEAKEKAYLARLKPRPFQRIAA
jgi:hypothetical protein